MTMKTGCDSQQYVFAENLAARIIVVRAAVTFTFRCSKSLALDLADGQNEDRLIFKVQRSKIRDTLTFF